MKIKVKINPNSKKNQIISYEDDLLKIKIHAAPEKHKANIELINFLSKILKIAKSQIQISKGQTSRLKTLIINDLTVEEFKLLINNTSKYTSNTDFLIKSKDELGKLKEKV